MLRKLLIGTASLIALFAIAGSALFFAEPTSAQTTGNRFGDRAGQFGMLDKVTARGNHGFGDKEKDIERAAEKFGMTVEALQAELDAGKTFKEIAAAQGVELPVGRRGHGGKGHAKFGKIDRAAIVAEALGITVDELKAARQEGTTLNELAEANGTTMDAVKEVLVTATVDAVNQAVADGDITQERADMVLAKIELKSLAHDIFNKEDAATIAAEMLGITVDELKAARKEGTKLNELAEANGTTAEAIKEAVKSAREAAIQAAVDDGTLTAEQGEQLLNGRGHKKGHGFGGHKHNGRNNRKAAPAEAEA
ncbi:MAG: hypothetical protein ACPG8W_13280 [Candidatus Promineifilaceae bacterium]